MPKGKNEKVVRLVKDKLGGKIVKEVLGLRTKRYSYLKDNKDEGKKPKRTKKHVIEWKFKFEGYKNCLEAAKIENKINHLEKIKLM